MGQSRRVVVIDEVFRHRVSEYPSRSYMPSGRSKYPSSSEVLAYRPRELPSTSCHSDLGASRGSYRTQDFGSFSQPRRQIADSLVTSRKRLSYPALSPSSSTAIRSGHRTAGTRGMSDWHRVSASSDSRNDTSNRSRRYSVQSYPSRAQTEKASSRRFANDARAPSISYSGTSTRTPRTHQRRTAPLALPAPRSSTNTSRLSSHTLASHTSKLSRTASYETLRPSDSISQVSGPSRSSRRSRDNYR